MTTLASGFAEDAMQAYVDATGAVTIPSGIREQIGLEAGDRVDVGLDADGRVTLTKVGARELAAPRTRPDPERFRKLRGTLRSDMTTDEIMLELRGERDDLSG